MPLFRRRPVEPEPLTFTVGVDGHRVVVGGPLTGCALLDDVESYVDRVAERTTAGVDGRDAVAVQSAKMDYAEMVDSMISVLTLALEELAQRDMIIATEVPAKPQLQRLSSSLATYDFIQAAYGRAQQRVTWARAVDGLLRARGVAVLWPGS
jgi:hypothetical protein